MNHILWLIFDSARYDAFCAARTPAVDRLGPARRCFSYASWTAPSHYAYLMGLTPHDNAPGRLAADVHREELAAWQQRIGADDGRPVSFADFVPRLSLPAYLKSLGYRTEAYVSMPVLNPHTLISRHFDLFELMPAHNDLAAIVDRLTFTDQPLFCFINTGETHYPYVLPHETQNDLPHLSGLHGVWRDLDDFVREGGQALGNPACDLAIDVEALRPLWLKQVACLEYLDGVVASLLERVPANTWIMVTSDHGELFGEDGFFGHGPVMHEKVFEVFFAEGAARSVSRPPVKARDEPVEQDVIMARLRRLGYV